MPGWDDSSTIRNFSASVQRRRWTLCTTSTVGYVLALSLDIPPDLPLRYAEVSGRNGGYSTDILGFSLGGYAILVGFGDNEFLDALRGRDENGPSPYMNVNGAFVHFIIVESITLFLAMTTSAIGIDSWWGLEFLGTFFLFYTATTIVAATFAVLTMASWYDRKPK